MAGKTSAERYHLRRVCAVTVTFQARKSGHSHAMNYLIFVAPGACLFVRLEIVAAAGVTLAATDVPHEYVPGMAVRITQSDRPLRDLRKMAVPA
ncbi:hypothetical protein NBG4_920004 [Candidatus Sulfobium mesophilum]|uniref:Uncharacterized protein n=1 Tax=Candidatus Sulfobium mesophilum TaxID=2016548 RepID=A0A2U3QL48_9BACT|nr:hypothetical protein NBG4_920004 [Candidatus Sulfobium mesophilum]